jgi:acetolactate synthase I/II/III large subunit
MIGGAALEEKGLEEAHRIAAATGAKLLAPTFNRLIQRGRGRRAIPLLPYLIDNAVAMLSGIRHLILVGCPAPVGFFAYPGKPGSPLPQGTDIQVLARPEEDGVEALTSLASELSAPMPAPAPRSQPPGPASGRITSASVAQTLAALIPDGAIIVDESISFGFSFYPGTHDAAPHDWLQLCGGSIGEGMPLATGAAIGAPGRRVINLEGDGSACYTVQSLWTQAREELDVTTVILSNRKYAILEAELTNVGARPGPTALGLLDLQKPDLNWVDLAAGLGVEATRAHTLEQFAELLTMSNRRKGPFLIDLCVA